ncbi:Capsular exopolysaccharide family protein [Alloalcanivorax dieselolei B5]|uniref:Capsular exopolysaccharide family protein n=1 Tax=Alcanivorax dieselolei (strain DSM 16502 / CGMCC 1.3690 / MCCC 1A00001 / B-5) TaxID=930169 RepID=K0CE85_ALCDB|nr:polysaccharide biosynthesis tyrosine autokinase [Alloalcanivorax dieselolei]AFT69977.1 Capsular exopolysaccharide family protein [Alloalcanivorax dieselolei B5]GGJ88345.1 tyrosine protein kinase [Alloalcanivorax dieselolei]
MSSPQTNNSGRLNVINDEIDLRRLWGLLMDARWLVIGTTVLALMLGLAYGFVATPIYKADGLLQVEPKTSSMASIGDLNELLGQESSSEAEIQLIRSRMVLGQVVDQLHMDIGLAPERLPLIGAFGAPEPAPEGTPVPLFAGFRDSETYVTVNHFNVPDRLLDEPFTLQSEDGLPALYYDGDLVAKGPADQPLRSEDGSIHLELGEWQPGEEELTLTKYSILTVVNGIRASLGVSEVGKQTGIINMSYTGANKGRIRAVLNAIADNYVLQNIQRTAEEAEKSLEFLDQQLPEIKTTLNGAEEKLNAYRLKSESVDLSLETQSVLERLVSIEAKLNELKIKESEVSARFTREHPAYRTLLQQRRSLENEKAEINKQINQLPETQQEILRLMRDVEVNQEIYVALLNKVQELRIMRASTVGNVRVIDNALVQPEPVKPQKGLVAALAGLLGLMMSVGYVLVRAAFNRGVETPDQLEEQGISVYAAVPLSEHQQKLDRVMAALRRRKRGKHEPISLLAQKDPGDLAIEALRSLRTSLHFAMMEADNKVLMISGPSPGVGKSFVTANLAAVLAQVGQRVVVVDADMRKGHLHRYFENDGQTGLSSYLSGQADLEQVLVQTKEENLSFISRGQIPPNPAELLMHKRFGELMDRLSEQFDLVLVDTPPILAVTDAAIVGQLAGTSLIVARYGQNSVKEIDVTINRFEQNKVTIKGAILNCIERRASNEYGYYSYYKYSSDKS